MDTPAGSSPALLAEPVSPDRQLSVIIPVYNERDNLLPLWEETRDALESLGRTWEVLFVDDGSHDGSPEVLDGIRRSSTGVRVLRLHANSGQTAALLAGFREARGEVIVTLDGDRQNDPADIAGLLARLGDCDAAVGFRAGRADTWVRRVSSRIANTVRNALSGDDIIDTGCTLKVFRRECLAAVPEFDGMHRFLPTLFRMAGHRVCQAPVSHRPRVAGTSKYGISNRLFRGLHDLLAIRWMKRRRLRYLSYEQKDKG